MNGSDPKAMDELVGKLEQLMARVPGQIVISELQTTVERLSFCVISNKDGSFHLDYDTARSVLGDDISPKMLRFVGSMIENNTVDQLVGHSGRKFLAYCSEFYMNVPELKVSTAVSLSNKFANEMTSALRVVHPWPVRIVFQVSPIIIAGFIISDKGSNHDHSLRTHIDKFIPKFVEQRILHILMEPNNGQ